MKNLLFDALKEFCPLSSECLSILRSVVPSMNLTARSYFKVIKIARTIADLAGEKEIIQNHLAEALMYRPKDSEF
ncbi:MAG: Mg chelatase, subunit ChlI [Microgenomates group bacterium GW2011_GWC1_37_8]|nr:MAG: Mg chelatase, subunit ChlI [Microgenomates group bacterium GW2011_GWC1_37_8]